MYCKDWLYGAFDPRWPRAVYDQLPRRLQPRNAHDMLGGLDDAALLVSMAYLGAQGTRTPLHVDKSLSIAFNCIVWREAECAEASKRWWIFHPSDKAVVDAAVRHRDRDARLEDDLHWLDADALTHDAQLAHSVVRFDQVLGEVVVVPPGAPHCVVNRGGLTFAVAANLLDVSVALEAVHLERENRALRVRNNFKVRCAVWGSLRRRLDAHLPVEPPLLAACRVIVDDEARGLEAGGALPDVPDAVRVRALEFVSMVTCDWCGGDIFNSYALMDDERTFCLLDCAAQARAHLRHRMARCVPVSLAQLRDELDRAASLTQAPPPTKRIKRQ